MMLEAVNTEMTVRTYRILGSECIQHKKLGISHRRGIQVKKKTIQMARSEGLYFTGNMWE
jgi:hypothetical protein